MRLFSKLIPLAMLGFIAATGDASAAFNLRLPKAYLLPQPATQIVETESEMAPIAYVKFCLNYGDQCQANGGDRRIELTDDVWAKIVAVNATVNDRIRPDAAKGAFNWSLDTTFGNCNDYAVQKRKSLIDQGMPMSALSLSVVLTSWGEGHLVLTVRTDRGDFVLDNLRPNILAWNHTGYHWDRVQSAADPQTWVAASNVSNRHQERRIVRVSHPAQVEEAAKPAVIVQHAGFVPLQLADLD